MFVSIVHVCQQTVNDWAMAHLRLSRRQCESNRVYVTSEGAERIRRGKCDHLCAFVPTGVALSPAFHCSVMSLNWCAVQMNCCTTTALMCTAS